jgi:hypothetical protein
MLSTAIDIVIIARYRGHRALALGVLFLGLDWIGLDINKSVQFKV